MNKAQFIAYMNKKLAVIKEVERKDIIDEYCNHIDEKVAEGMKEEDVIAGFGDIDEMVKEILDAYNIDYTHAKAHQNAGFDRKVNDFLDMLFEHFQMFLSQFTRMDVESVLRLLFEVLVVLIVLSLLYIPFHIIAGVGSGILRGLFWYGLGSIFGWVWSLIIKLLYIAMFVAVLINVTIRRWSHYKGRNDKPIMDDVKASFNFEQAKEAVHRFTNGDGAKKQTWTSTNPDTQQEEDDPAFAKEAQYQESVEEDRKEDLREEEEPSHNRYEYTKPPYERTTTASIFYSILKFFGFLLMIPFILLIIGLCCALGFMIILSFQGISIIGFYFIVIGSLLSCGAVIGLIDRFFCKGGRSI